MRSPKRFSGCKLTTEEFTDKYRSGDPYNCQYIPVSIEDGRDEGEQLIFNNIQQLKDRCDIERKLFISNTERRDKEIGELKKEFADVKKATVICSLTSAAVALISVSVLCTLHCQKNMQCQKLSRS